MPRATAAPPVTASEPPSQKSFCTSTMMSARISRPYPSRPVSPLAQVQITQQGDLGAMMNDLPVDMQHEGGQRVIGEGTFGWATRPGETVGVQASDARYPPAVCLVQLTERGVGRSRVVER